MWTREDGRCRLNSVLSPITLQSRLPFFGSDGDDEEDVDTMPMVLPTASSTIAVVVFEQPGVRGGGGGGGGRGKEIWRDHLVHEPSTLMDGPKMCIRQPNNECVFVHQRIIDHLSLLP
jgi:hypothetical protein